VIYRFKSAVHKVLKEQLCLRKKITSGKTVRKTVEVEIGKKIVRSSTGLWKVSDWLSWRGWPL
jgi:hypothetical protein